MTIRETRGVFARCLLDCGKGERAISIGSILLRPHQRTAVTRANAAIAEFGGALVSDHVGTGKTYVALALAANSQQTTVVAPAVLRDMWIAAAATAQVQISFVSTESLSRRGVKGDVSGTAGLVIVDEAHHFRNPATRRFSALARLCSRRKVVLLSGTPIHNRRRDLEVLLSLFIGSRAASLSTSEMGRVVIRRSRDRIASSAPMPDVMAPRWCELTHDDDIPQLLLSLPPPLSPRDAGDAGALVVHSLIRQWVSSDAALHRSLVRRLQKATALVAALESGAYPSEADLTSWISGDDCVQLGFAELMSPANPDSQSLLAVVSQHMEAVQSLARRLKATNRRDVERAEIIRAIRKEHDGVGIVAFSQYADTVEGLFELLARDGSIAVLNGSGARVFGGRISRAEAISRFAPHASGKTPPRAAEAVTLLLTTDILSEGVNLQDAGVVIHLDLPWTPARMEQRVGRVARMGSRHERVFSYLMRPPASADTLIRTETILRDKMETAGIVTDGLQSLLPDGPGTERDHNLPRVVEELRAILEDWKSDTPETPPDKLVASTVIAPTDGFVALIRWNGQYRIFADDGQGVTDDPARVLALIRCASGEEAGIVDVDLARAVRSIKRHLKGVRALGSPHSQSHPRQLTQRAALKRIARISHNARPHERSYLAPESSRARATILGYLSAGQEAQLAELSAARMPDRDWLREVTRLSSVTSDNLNADSLIAMILFRKLALKT